MRVDIIVFDGVDEMDAWGPCEVLRGAGGLGADVSVRLLTRRAVPTVTGAYGLRFEPDGVFSPGEADVVIVPGGGWAVRADVGAWGEVHRGEWLPVIAAAAERTELVASVCTGAMLLAHAGVVGDRRVATHRSAYADLAAMGATVISDRVVDDGDLVTSGGVTSGIDLALWLLEREVSPEVARQVAERMEYSPARPALA